MNEDQSSLKREKKIQTILIIVLILISIVAVLGLTYIINTNDNGQGELTITKSYSGITPRIASDLMNTSDNLVIVDVRECKCNYNKGHLIDATWEINPSNFFNTTSDLLIYDNWEDICIEFCEKLVNNTYGVIYFLEGGINAWNNAGYPTVKENS